jgi:hypothetical protein
MIINSIKDFMKKNTPNLFIDLQNYLISIQGHFNSTSKKVSIIVLFAFFCTTISAQNGNTVTPKIIEVKSYISSLKAVEQNMNLHYSNAQNVENLVYNLQPSIYFFSGDTKTYGENPKNLYTDVASLNAILSAGLQEKNIEIAIIKINNANDLNSKIDLSIFSNFYKLKYIYIISSVTTTEQNIVKMLNNYDEQYSIFYKIEIGE